jgi:hypothetical protein
MAGATAWEKEGERVLADRGLTLSTPVRSAGPEERRRRRILGGDELRSGEESGKTAATPGAGLRFFGLGGRGWHCGPSQLVGEAGGGVGRRRYMLGSDYCEFSRERGRGRPTGKKGRAPGREEKEEG